MFNGKRLSGVDNGGKVVGVLAIVGIVVASGVVFSTVFTGSATASMQASGFNVGDGSANVSSVQSIKLIGNGGSATWSDLPSAPTDADVRVYAEGPNGEMHAAGSQSCSPVDQHHDCVYNGTAASGEVSFGAGAYGPNVYLFDHTPWTPEDFEAAPGETIERTITVRIEVEVMYDGGSVTATASDTSTIRVTNPESGDNDSGEEPSVTVVTGDYWVDIVGG